ncbi:MAG: hypothetical protein NT090_01255 [Acidobacteria bacterium]|nr:hypothetical protein [Acidobacteriota bacterium]
MIGQRLLRVESRPGCRPRTGALRPERPDGRGFAPGARRGLAVRIRADGHPRTRCRAPSGRGQFRCPVAPGPGENLLRFHLESPWWKSFQRGGRRRNRLRHAENQTLGPPWGRPFGLPGPSPRAVEAVLPELPFSALLAGSNNDGNTVEGMRYLL